MKAETFDGEEEVGWWTPDGRQTHVGPPQHWDRDQVLLLLGKLASLPLKTFGIALLDCAASCEICLWNTWLVMVKKGTLDSIENDIGDVWVPVGSV